MPSDSAPPEPPRVPKPAGAGGAAPTSPRAPRLALAVATGLGVGLVPVAPGTFGALVGAGVFLALAALPGWLWLISVLGLCALGVWSSTLAEQWFGRDDDGRIVIDEVAGQVIALAPLLFFRPASLFSGLVTGFVAFRVFDIWKPGPVRWAEQNFKGGVGVMADDIVAGAMAASILVVLGALGGFEWHDGHGASLTPLLWSRWSETREVQPL